MKNLFRNIVLVFCLFIPNLLVGQQAYEPAKKFITTIKEISLYNDTTSSWLVIAKNQTFDIASVNPGAAIGQMAGIGQIPDGTYSRLKIKVSGAFTWESEINPVNKGSSNINFNAAGFNFYAEDTTDGVYADGTSGFVTITNFSSPLIFPIPQGVVTDFRIDFDVSQVIDSYLNQITFPTITITINGETYTISGIRRYRV